MGSLVPINSFLSSSQPGQLEPSLSSTPNILPQFSGLLFKVLGAHMSIASITLKTSWPGLPGLLLL